MVNMWQAARKGLKPIELATKKKKIKKKTGRIGRLLHLVQRGGAWAGCGPAQSPPRCTKCNIPPIKSQCTNFILFNVAL